MTDPKKPQGGNGHDQVSLAKMLAHPLRLRILQSVGEEVKSPNMLANELGEPLGNVSYHVKTLVEGGALVLDRTEPRRGAVEHFYRFPPNMRETFRGGLAL